MVVASDGKISIQNSKNASQMQVVSGKAIVRTAKAPEEPVTLNGKYNFKTVEEIADRRIRPTLPPQATEISLLSTRGGHFARYRVEEDHFIEFLDKLWEAKKNSSAHKVRASQLTAKEWLDVLRLLDGNLSTTRSHILARQSQVVL